MHGLKFVRNRFLLFEGRSLAATTGWLVMATLLKTTVTETGNGLLLRPANYGIFVGLSRLVPAYQRILGEILESVRYLQVMSAYLQIAF